MTEVVSTEEIKCRLPLDLNREAKEYDVIYFMSTFEEGNQIVELTAERSACTLSFQNQKCHRWRENPPLS